MMLCLSPESTERVSVGTGSGELQRPIHLQPLGGQVGGWDWGEASQVLRAQDFRRSSSRGASSESTPNSKGFLTLHTLGATLVRECTG